MDSVTIIRIIAGVLFMSGLVLLIFYLMTLSNILKKCSPSSRTLPPGQVWLCIIPLFGLVWMFVTVIAVSDSLGKEFRLRNINVGDEAPAKTIGIVMAVLFALNIVPIINLLVCIPGLVLWGIHWVKIAGYSRQLDQPVLAYQTPPVF